MDEERRDRKRERRARGQSTLYTRRDTGRNGVSNLEGILYVSTCGRHGGMLTSFQMCLPFWLQPNILHGSGWVAEMDRLALMPSPPNGIREGINYLPKLYRIGLPRLEGIVHLA